MDRVDASEANACDPLGADRAVWEVLFSRERQAAASAARVAALKLCETWGACHTALDEIAGHLRIHIVAIDIVGGKKSGSRALAPSEKALRSRLKRLRYAFGEIETTLRADVRAPIPHQLVAIWPDNEVAWSLRHLRHLVEEAAHLRAALLRPVRKEGGPKQLTWGPLIKILGQAYERLGQDCRDGRFVAGLRAMNEVLPKNARLVIASSSWDRRVARLFPKRVHGHGASKNTPVIR